MAAEPDQRHGVFVEDFVDVAASLAAVHEALLAGESLLGPMAVLAEDAGASTLLRIGPAWAAEFLKREVRASFGGVRPRGEGLVLWLRWEVVGLRPLFPVLDGDLEVAPIGEDLCRVTLSASYEPPLGLVGRGLDRALFHRVAQSTVRSFLAQLGEALLKPSSATGNLPADDPPTA